MLPSIIHDNRIIKFTQGISESPIFQVAAGLRSWYAKADFGEIVFHNTCSKRFHAFVSHYSINEPVVFKLEDPSPKFLLHYSIKGDFSYHHPSIGNRQVVVNKMNLHYFPAFVYEMQFPGKGEYSTLDIIIPHNQLLRLNSGFPILEQFLQAASEGKACSLMQSEMPDNSKVRSIIRDILLCDMDEKNMRNTYLSDKSSELLIEFLRLVSQRPAAATYISKQDIEAANKVRNFLLENLQSQSPPSVRELSKLAGINEKKLEAAFRHLYETTVVGYFRKAQADEIYRMVVQSDVMLKRIAEIFDYKNYANFSSAFKTRFGISPKEARNMAQTKYMPRPGDRLDQ